MDYADIVARERAAGANVDCVPVAATDPLNLAGIVTAGARVAAAIGSRLLFRDGVPVATLIAGRVERLDAEEPVPVAWQNALQPRGATAGPVKVAG